MYEKTIAGEHRTYAITIPESPTDIYDLLQPADQADYDSLLSAGVPVEPIKYPSFNGDNRYRVPIDGYIVSTAGNFNVRTAVGGVDEVVNMGFQYVVPVYFWPHKTWVSASAPTSAIIRIFFS